MRPKTVLIIEDDADITELVRFNLEKEGFRVVIADSGEEGLEKAWTDIPTLVLLDLGLPGVQGTEVCRIFKHSSRTSSVPIIMLTARSEEHDVVAGLDLGADDYISKPFKLQELLARIRAVLRRSRGSAQEQEENQLSVGPLLIDSDRHEVYKESELLSFTLAEFRLLRILAANAGRVLSRDRLLAEITEGTTFIIDRNVDVHIRSIRKKLGQNRDLIKTVRGVGYKFQARTPGASQIAQG